MGHLTPTGTRDKTGHTGTNVPGHPAGHQGDRYEVSAPNVPCPVPVPVPALGEGLITGGQRYVCVGWRPHIRVDGEPAILILWATRCAECGASTQFTASVDRGPENRRCRQHAAPGRKVRHA